MTPNIGGTEGGLGNFVLGFILAAVGFYLLTNRVHVSTGGWMLWGYNGFGLSLVPLLLGIGLLAFSGKSFIGWLLTLAGLAIIVAGILSNMSIYFVRTTLWEALIMLAMLAFGFGLMARSLRSQPAKK